MSTLFLANDEQVWWPANGVARLFLDQTRSLERLVGHASGVSDIMSDEITIDGPTFAAFVAAIVKELERTNHPFLLIMAVGYCTAAMALNHKINGAWPTVSSKLQEALSKAQALREYHLNYG